MMAEEDKLRLISSVCFIAAGFFAGLAIQIVYRVLFQ